MGDMTAIAQWRFRRAVDRHHTTVYRFAAGLLRDASEAEDVTQETFAQYWRQGADVKQPKAWLLRVARNNCLDRLRKSVRLDYREHAEIPEAIEHRDAPMHMIAEQDTARLRTAISHLPEPQRSLIVMFSLQGMSGKHCAQVLNLTLTQVKVYLHRAKAKLRETMETEDE